MPRQVPHGFTEWPKQSQELKPHEVVQMYDAGFSGCFLYEEEKEQIESELAQLNNGMMNASDIAHASGFADSGAGKLILLFLEAATTFPGCYPGPAQQRGDCVSHGGSGAALLTLGGEITLGRPDPVTGIIEGKPQLSEAGVKNSVISSEWNYWHRNHGGDGWQCAACVKVMLEQGIMLRQPYPELSIDLTTYSGSLAGKYGRTAPPSNFQVEGRKHIIRTATPVNSAEACRDMLYNRYGIIDCGSEGYAKTRDANGVSKRSGSWAHSMKEGGFDDRDVIKKLYNEPLVLIGNNWAVWNGGPRDIIDSAQFVPQALKEQWIAWDLVNPSTGNIMIPKGWFWTPWSQAKNRYRMAMSSINGWPSQKLPDYVSLI